MSARSTLEVIGGSLTIVIFAILVLGSMGLFLSHLSHRTIEIGKARYDVEVADTDDSRADGLSGRKDLAADKGMLFTFDKPAVQCMWMKDMNFPIDMIWLNHDKEVIYTEADVSPRTYPKTFCSDDTAQYVIELNTGQIERSGLSLGSQISF